MWPSRAFKALAIILIVYVAIFCASGAEAGTSVNIPLGSRIYVDLDRLEVKGLLPSSMLSTRPVGRLEAARLVREAARLAGSKRKSKGSRAGRGIVERLEGEFAVELKGHGASTYLKPVDSLYVRSIYSEDAPYFLNVNNNGDALARGGSLRAGLSLKGGLLDVFSLYLNPEYRLGKDYSYGRLVAGYIKADLFGIELQGGKDALWWGPGRHGGLLLTDNAEALEMVKLTSRHPFTLPWVFGRLGLVRPTVFLARLEKDRDFPRANLLGMRLEFKPTTRLQVGMSRVFMFGGEGRRGLDFSDWLEVFTAQDSAEHSNSPINGNQIVSVDISYVYVSQWRALPFSGVKLYTEWGAEDSSGETKTPTGRANICGVYVDEPFWLRNLDLRVEWANTARNRRYGPAWYKHGRYTSGYTHRGRVIGHHMGGDARDLFLRAQYHMGSGGLVAVETDYEKSSVHSLSVTRRRWWGAEISVPLGASVVVTAGGGHEQSRLGSGEKSQGASGYMAIELKL